MSTQSLNAATKPTAGLPARAGAVSVLADILGRGRPLDEAFETETRTGRLARAEPRDRGFARAIIATTLRRLGQIDAALDACLTQPLPARAGTTRHILRAAAAELLFLHVSPHAAVDSAVNLAAADRNARHFKALVNAIARRLARDGAALIAAQDAETLNTPAWLWQSWCQTYGEPTARAIAQAHLTEPPLDLSVKQNPTEWAARLGGEIVGAATVRLAAGNPPVETLDGFADGAWWVQDAAATLPATLLGAVTGRDVLDLCAAPGGKTAELAAAGARVTALDRSSARLQRLAENLARLKLDATLVKADATTWDPDRLWPLILLDAPCSATGTIRRHPDVARVKTPKDRDKLTALQARLLDRAAGWLEPGGTLIYATCSLEPEEGPAQIAAFLARHPSFARAPIHPDELSGLADGLSAEGDLRTLPCHLADKGGMDGFFAARLTRQNP